MYLGLICEVKVYVASAAWMFPKSLSDMVRGAATFTGFIAVLRELHNHHRCRVAMATTYRRPWSIVMATNLAEPCEG